VKFGIVFTTTRVMGCLCMTAAVASVACANGSGAPTSPTANSATASVSAAGPSNATTAAVEMVAAKAAATGCPAWGNPGGNSGMKFVGILSPADGVARSVAQITDAWYAANNFVKQEVI